MGQTMPLPWGTSGMKRGVRDAIGDRRGELRVVSPIPLGTKKSCVAERGFRT